MASNGLSMPSNTCQYHSRLRTLLGEIQDDADIDFHVENTPGETDEESDSDLTDSDNDSDASTVYENSEERYANEDVFAKILCGESS